ncbi:rRNA maturation RNase YbeY [Eubacteriales bacterium OttesenSCG-928-N13]|nr:rRNA maturation RNase YbeY [Eubacteriales bacterium OttesenSCG-928-N13]
MIELSIETTGAPEGLTELLGRVSRACTDAEGVPEMISFGRLLDDEQIRVINRDFRGIDRATDVLSFPSIQYRMGQTAHDALRKLRHERDPESGLMSLGDFAISLPTAMRQAEEYGHSLARELCYLCAHAQFHLMGYDHETEQDKRVMRQMEERALDGIGISRERVDAAKEE